jgi:hypothetical protein
MGTAETVAAARRALMAQSKPAQQAVGSKQAPASPASTVASAGAAQRSQVPIKPQGTAQSVAGRPSLYALACVLIVALGVAAVWKANVAFAPEMYAQDGMATAAKANAAGKNYAVFDLNINIRRWKEELVARMTETPDVVVLGASHWQEAHSGLVRSEKMFNGHVHRDYWEDLLGVAEVYVRNNRLPKRMIIAIRDKQFTPVEMRKDFLWEPGIPNYRAMADRLQIEKEDAWKTYPYQRMKERFSLSMLFNNVTRWYNAKERPHETPELHFAHLDTLLPDGSILWSSDHMAIFTPERTKRESLAFAESARKNPPVADPKGLAAFDALLGYLKKQGVQVVLVHPPFNPIFYDAVKNSAYLDGLDKIRTLTRGFAAKHDLNIIGEFDPAKVGCTSDQYIDAEHASPACLQKIFDQYEALLPQLKLEAQGKQL